MANIKAIEDELNRLYEYEIDKYLDECNVLKKMGFKIYRNSDGIHKVVKPVKNSDVRDFINGIFGTNIFG